ncbi:unnamed protein product [Heligmosomoides polygyrus]|uniref:Reverse transcriptase domain-containing protein n=1 Tax=Heligmosomoides polygyrus TaxID=6339 RepID=A0A183FVH9_HELPZ|nr:unnamed protein product [Heligmosomoides polygyrus]
MLYSSQRVECKMQLEPQWSFPSLLGCTRVTRFPHSSLLSSCHYESSAERQMQAWCDRLAMFGLKLNVKKTEYLTTDVNESGSIKINGTELARTSLLKHLESAIASDGGLMVEVNATLRPVAMYGVECWPATKEVERRLSVMETKMLRWAAGVTRMDCIRNDAIRQKLGVAPIADKMREARCDGTVTLCVGKKTALPR